MPQIPLLHLRHVSSFQPVDDALKQAFAPVLKEAVPDRFRVALDALGHKGSFDDPARNDS